MPLIPDRIICSFSALLNLSTHYLCALCRILQNGASFIPSGAISAQEKGVIHSASRGQAHGAAPSLHFGAFRVIIAENGESLGELTHSEQDHLAEREIRQGYRLACQVHPRESLVVKISEETGLRIRQVQSTGQEREVRLNPGVVKVHVTVPQPTLSDVLPDPERLIQTLRHYGHLPNPRIDHDLLPILPRLLREYQWDVTEVLPTLSQVCALERGDTTSEMYGYVVDIGTSKLVGVLVDLVAGEALNTLFVENPQLPLTSQFKEGLDSEGPRAEIMGLPKLTPGLLEITSVGPG